MKTEFPIITYANLVENQNKPMESVASLFEDYCYQRVGPGFYSDDEDKSMKIKQVEVTPQLFASLIGGENAMLKRAFHEVPKLVSTILLLQSNDGHIFVYFDIETPDCGEGLCRFLAPLARTACEREFVKALVTASQSAKELNRLWIKGGRQYHPLTNKETFEKLYPESAKLASIEAGTILPTNNQSSD